MADRFSRVAGRAGGAAGIRETAAAPLAGAPDAGGTTSAWPGAETGPVARDCSHSRRPR